MWSIKGHCVICDLRLRAMISYTSDVTHSNAPTEEDHYTKVPDCSVQEMRTGVYVTIV